MKQKNFFLRDININQRPKLTKNVNYFFPMMDEYDRLYG